MCANQKMRLVNGVYIMKVLLKHELQLIPFYGALSLLTEFRH